MSLRCSFMRKETRCVSSQGRFIVLLLLHVWDERGLLLVVKLLGDGDSLYFVFVRKGGEVVGVKDGGGLEIGLCMCM